MLRLLGPNGSGKSTTLKALGGLLRPSRGRCLIFGHPAGSDEARALVGYLPELPQFPAHLTGREFLHYCAGLSSLGDELAAESVPEILQWSGSRSLECWRPTFSNSVNSKLFVVVTALVVLAGVHTLLKPLEGLLVLCIGEKNVRSGQLIASTGRGGMLALLIGWNAFDGCQWLLVES